MYLCYSLTYCGNTKIDGAPMLLLHLMLSNRLLRITLQRKNQRGVGNIMHTKQEEAYSSGGLEELYRVKIRLVSNSNNPIDA